MKKILGLMIPLSMLVVFSACSNDNDNDVDCCVEPPQKDPEVAMEETYEKFLENLEEGNYYFLYEDFYEKLEAEVYADGTYSVTMPEEGGYFTLVCGIDDEYSISAHSDTENYFSEDDEGYFTEEDIKELCENEFDDVGYDSIIEYDNLEGLFDELDDAIFAEEDDYYVAVPEDEDEYGDEEIRVYKDGKKLEIIGDGIELVLEVL